MTKIFLFADNTNIYYKTDDLTRLSKMVNKELNKVKTWMDCNKLALKIDKTNFVLFYSPKKKLTDLIPLKFGKERIKRTK